MKHGVLSTLLRVFNLKKTVPTLLARAVYSFDDLSLSNTVRGRRGNQKKLAIFASGLKYDPTDYSPNFILTLTA